jgi:hypothetical protein
MKSSCRSTAASAALLALTLGGLATLSGCNKKHAEESTEGSAPGAATAKLATDPIAAPPPVAIPEKSGETAGSGSGSAANAGSASATRAGSGSGSATSAGSGSSSGSGSGAAKH